MSHLTRDELLRFAEGALDASRALHLGACAACRDEAEALASIVADVRSVDVPEPAPAFWDHLATRVRRAIDQEPSAGSWWRGPWHVPRLAWAAAGAVLVAGLALYLAWPVANRPAATRHCREHRAGRARRGGAGLGVGRRDGCRRCS